MDSQIEDRERNKDFYITELLDLFMKYKNSEKDKDDGHERTPCEYFEDFQKKLNLPGIQLQMQIIRELYKKEAVKLKNAGMIENGSKPPWFPLAEYLFSHNWEEEISRNETSSSLSSDDSSLKTKDRTLENFHREPRKFPSLPSTHKLTSSKIDMVTSMPGSTESLTASLNRCTKTTAKFVIVSPVVMIAESSEISQDPIFTNDLCSRVRLPLALHRPETPLPPVVSSSRTGIPLSQTTPSHRIGNITSVSIPSRAGCPIWTYRSHPTSKTEVHFPSAAPLSRADHIPWKYKTPPPCRMNVKCIDSPSVWNAKRSSIPRQFNPPAPTATRRRLLPKTTSSDTSLSKNTAITSAQNRLTSTVIPTVDGETSSSTAVSSFQLSSTIPSTDDVPLSLIVTPCATRRPCSTSVTYSLSKDPIFTNNMCSRVRLPHALHRSETPLPPVVSTFRTGIPLSQTTPSHMVGNIPSVSPPSRAGYPIWPNRYLPPSRTEVHFPSAAPLSRADHILRKYKTPPPYRTNVHLTSVAASSSSSVLTPAFPSSGERVLNANAPSSSTNILTSAGPYFSTSFLTSAAPASISSIPTSVDPSSRTCILTSATLSSSTSNITSATPLSRAGHSLWPYKLPPPYRKDSDFTSVDVSSSSTGPKLASPSSKPTFLKSTAPCSNTSIPTSARPYSSTSILTSVAPSSRTSILTSASPSSRSSILTSAALSSSAVHFPSAVAYSSPRVLKSTDPSSSTCIRTSATKSSSNSILTSVSPSSISTFTSAAPSPKAGHSLWLYKQPLSHRRSVPLTSAAASYRSSVRSSVYSTSQAGVLKTTAPTSTAKLHILPDNSNSASRETVPLSSPASPNMNGVPFPPNSSIADALKSTVPCSNTSAASTISTTITSPSGSQSRNLNCCGSCYTIWGCCDFSSFINPTSSNS